MQTKSDVNVLDELVGTRVLFANSDGIWRFKREFSNYEYDLNTHDYALHMNCAWRVRKRGLIVYGGADSSAKQTYRDRARIDPQVRGYMLKYLDLMGSGELFVRRASVIHRCDLRLELVQGFVLETFGDTNSNEEVLRILCLRDERQWVIASRDGLIPSKAFVLPVDDTAKEPFPDPEDSGPPPRKRSRLG